MTFSFTNCRKTFSCIARKINLSLCCLFFALSSPAQNKQKASSFKFIDKYGINILTDDLSNESNPVDSSFMRANINIRQFISNVDTLNNEYTCYIYSLKKLR